MPQPAAVDDAAQRLIQLFRDAQADVEQQLAAITEGRRAVRLRELRTTIGALLDGLESSARDWLQSDLPSIYELGGQAAAEVFGDSFVWTQPHIAAVQQLAARSFDDLLSATRFVASDTKRWIRDEARQQLTLSLIEGRTARQAAAVLSDAAGSELGLFAVRYKDGSLHTLDDYADSAVRAVSAETYNVGTINQSKQLGVQFFECIDGAECGLASHDDNEKPNGRIYPAEVAEGNTIAHPRCRRSWIPRIDATSTDAEPLRPETQRADQARNELAKSRRNRRVPRADRGARTPRTPRVQPPRYPGDLSTSEASAWLRDQWGVDEDGKRRFFDLAGLGPDSANITAKTIDDLMVNYPETAKRLRAFGSSAPVTKAVQNSTPYRFPRISGRAYADAARQVGSIRLSPKLKDVGALSESWARDLKTGFHPAGTDGVEAIVSHEFGHHLLWTANANAAGGAGEVSTAINGVFERLTGLTAEDGGAFYRARFDLIRSQISRYATSNEDELVAEAFSMVHGSEPSPLARAIVDAVAPFAEG